MAAEPKGRTVDDREPPDELKQWMTVLGKHCNLGSEMVTMYLQEGRDREVFTLRQSTAEVVGYFCASCCENELDYMRVMEAINKGMARRAREVDDEITKLLDENPTITIRRQS